MIEVEHLTKYYGDVPVVRDVTFNVEPGEILGFLGPNGAGKTTTMRMITGYLPPTSGTVRVAGFDVNEKSLEARSRIGYLPETVPLYPELTTFEYLNFRGQITGIHNSRERRSRIYEVMEVLNLTDVANQLVGNLSRGYRQRVGFAQAMLHNPDVLILDEPTVGLDPVQITEVRNLIKELGQDHTVILSTHLLPEVSMVCDRVIIINRGRLVALDTPIHLAEGVAEMSTLQLEIGGTPAAVLKSLRSVPGVQAATLISADGASAEDALGAGVNAFQVTAKPGADVRPALASAVVGAGHQLLELRTVRPTLEEVFINVISQEQPEDAFYEDGELPGGDVEGNGQDYEADGEDEAEEVAASQVRERVVTRRRGRR
jgi:ABC-2 type transport system ATP-binding protein